MSKGLEVCLDTSQFSCIGQGCYGSGFVGNHYCDCIQGFIMRHLMEETNICASTTVIDHYSYICNQERGHDGFHYNSNNNGPSW